LVFSGKFENVAYRWSRLGIGAEYVGFTSPWSRFFSGLIDEIRISNIERSEIEIQEYYNTNQSFIPDTNTVGLWHLDENQGENIFGDKGPIGEVSNGKWNDGKFGSCLDFNGVNSVAWVNLSIPTDNMSAEFWLKPNGFPPPNNSWIPISLNDQFSAGFLVNSTVKEKTYSWSTGQTGNSVTVHPDQYPFVWVTDGSCTDTIYFHPNKITVYDTSYVSVTDTLFINTTISSVNPPGNTNTIKVYPNPASTQITLDFGNFQIMNGYKINIVNSLNQSVYANSISQQINHIDIGSWGGNGLYFIQLIDPQGNIIDIRKIVLQ
jgi:hypothetical protein